MSGQAVFDDKNLIGAPGEELRKLRGNQIGMVLQNPMTCFDPLYRIGSQMAETFAMHTDWNGEKIRSVSLEVLDQMRIHDGAEVLEKYPHQLSGGMLQRIMIGIAMALSPELLIADEPTTAIDAITQYEILEEFERIKREKKTAMIFITHDLGAISKVADRIMVMNHGEKVFDAPPKEVFRHYKELEAIGLAAPQVTYIVQGLKEHGMPIADDITTVAEAKDAILQLLGKDERP